MSEYYYVDEYFEDYSEYDRQIQEFKDGLIQAVKTEHREEMERLRKENAELQDVKNRIKNIELEHAEALRLFKVAGDRALYEAKRARLNELLSENFVRGWGVENCGEKYPKCNKCDEYRYVHYKTPLGKDAKEQCECDTRITRYEPLPVECYQFGQNKTKYGGEEYPRITMYFRRNEEKDYDQYNKTSNVYNGAPFEEVSRYGIVFLDKEKCQKYCDWLNTKET